MAQDYEKKITEKSAEMQTPNTVNTEVQETVQANSVRPEMHSEQPNVQETQTVQTVQPTKEYANAYTVTQPTTQTTQTNQTSQTNQTNQNAQEYVSSYTVTQQNAMNKAQEVQPLQSQSNVAIKVPTDLYDQTVQGYLDDYNRGREINDYQAQINALTSIDQYRTSQGLKSIYTQNIYDLTNQRTQKIQKQIREYETDMAEAMSTGDEELAKAIGQEMEEYKKMVNYSDTIDNSASYLENLEYKSTYDSVINGIVNELLSAKFTYDPSDDEALLRAQRYATNRLYESMNSKGILDSTMTSAIITKTVNELIPEYEKMAKEEFYENIDRLQTMATFIMNIDDRQYERWANQVQLKLDYYEAKKNEVSYQWERVDKLGYVDNEASIVLGVAPGTMSPAKREAIEEAELNATEQYNKLLTDIQLAQIKADLEVQVYSRKKAIDNNYSGSNNSGNSNKTSDSTTKYGSNISDSDKKKIIKTKYENGEIDEVEAVKQIYNNFDKKKVGGMLSDILDMTEKEANELLDENYANSLLQSAFDTYGEITNDNVAYFDKYVLDLLEAGEIDEETSEDMLKVIDQGLGYNVVKNDYESLRNIQISQVKKSSEKELKNKEYTRADITSQEEELVEKIGKPNYDKLTKFVEEKEKELEEALKEKGIEW